MKIHASVPTSFCIVALALTTGMPCLVGRLPATEIMSYDDGANDADSPHVIGSGHMVSQTREVSGFHGLDQKISGNIIITQGDHEGLILEGEDNILPLVETTVDKAGILHLGIKKQAGRISYEKG